MQAAGETQQSLDGCGFEELARGNAGADAALGKLSDSSEPIDTEANSSLILSTKQAEPSRPSPKKRGRPPKGDKAQAAPKPKPRKKSVWALPAGGGEAMRFFEPEDSGNVAAPASPSKQVTTAPEKAAQQTAPAEPTKQGAAPLPGLGDLLNLSLLPGKPA